MARQQLESLQERLKLKEENLVKTLQQVDELRRENNLMKITNEEQVKALQNKIKQAIINNKEVVVSISLCYIQIYVSLIKCIFSLVFLYLENDLLFLPLKRKT